MGDLTTIRRKMFKNNLVEPYKALMDEEKNPPTAEWLGGEDVHGAIRKAKANAGLADDIYNHNKWSKKSYNKNSRNNKPYDHQNGQKRNQFNPRRRKTTLTKGATKAHMTGGLPRIFTEGTLDKPGERPYT